MAGARIRVEEVLADFLTPILPNIGGEPIREGKIDLHQLVSGNVESVVSNLGGGRHRHLALTITAKEYNAHMGFSFVPPHNPGNYPQSMRNAQEQALGTEKFQQKQALFRKEKRSSRRWKQSFCTHWWAIWQGLDRCLHLPCPNTFLEIHDDKLNWPQVKFCEDDGALWLRRNLCLIDITIGKG